MKAEIVDWRRERRVSKPHAKLKKKGPLVRGLFVPSRGLLLAPAGPRKSPSFHFVRGYDSTRTRNRLTYQPRDTTGFLPSQDLWVWDFVEISAQDVRRVVQNLRRGEEIDKECYESLLSTLKSFKEPEEPEDVPF